MKSSYQRTARLMRIASLPLMLLAAGLCGQSAFAGGNNSGAPSGATVAGATTTPTTSMNGLTSVILSGTSPAQTTTTTTTSTGGTVLTTSMTLPSGSVQSTLQGAGLNLDPGQSHELRGPTGASYTVGPTNANIGTTIVRTASSQAAGLLAERISQVVGGGTIFQGVRAPAPSAR